jgi:hypothetical protein
LVPNEHVGVTDTARDDAHENLSRSWRVERHLLKQERPRSLADYRRAHMATFDCLLHDCLLSGARRAARLFADDTDTLSGYIIQCVINLTYRNTLLFEGNATQVADSSSRLSRLAGMTGGRCRPRDGEAQWTSVW